MTKKAVLLLLFLFIPLLALVAGPFVQTGFAQFANFTNYNSYSSLGKCWESYAGLGFDFSNEKLSLELDCGLEKSSGLYNFDGFADAGAYNSLFSCAVFAFYGQYLTIGVQGGLDVLFVDSLSSTVLTAFRCGFFVQGGDIFGFRFLLSSVLNPSFASFKAGFSLNYRFGA